VVAICSHSEWVTISGTASVLAMLGDRPMRDDVDRVAAAAGVRVVHAGEPSSRAVWAGAPVVLLDRGAAARCVAHGLPRRDRVLLLSPALTSEDWESAVAVGAERVLHLPGQDGELVATLSAAPDGRGAGPRRGPVVAVLGGTGGAGASLLTVAIAQAAAESLLIDADPWGGGLDLALGNEGEPGLRWPDLRLSEGRLGYDALRDVLPTHRGVTVLSGGRMGTEIRPGPLAAVIDAGRRAGVTVVCDVPRQPGPATETAMRAADLVVLITPADVRSTAAAAVTGGWAGAINPNVGLVVRGPAPGGLRADDVARTVGLPLLVSMRPQPGLDGSMERGGLRVRARSPLATAAGRILALLRQQPVAVPG
jgi:secretion/DNA translocation related CpaE-like protein